MSARREHPLHATLTIAKEGLRAGDVATRDLWAVRPDWSCRHTAERMAENNFDVAPVDEDPIWRFVSRAELEESLGDTPVTAAAHPIDTSRVVTADLGLAATLDLLAERGFLFVIDGGSVCGLITLSDLQRVPVSMMVLAIVLATEAGLNQLILAHYGSPGFFRHLSDGRREILLKRYEELRCQNLDTDPIDVLSLEDRLRLVGRVARFWKGLGFPSHNRYESWADQLKQLRNSLAHGRTILDHEPDPCEALALVHEVRAFAERVWDLVERGEAPGGDTAP